MSVRLIFVTSLPEKICHTVYALIPFFLYIESSVDTLLILWHVLFKFIKLHLSPSRLIELQCQKCFLTVSNNCWWNVMQGKRWIKFKASVKKLTEIIYVLFKLKFFGVHLRLPLSLMKNIIVCEYLQIRSFYLKLKSMPMFYFTYIRDSQISYLVQCFNILYQENHILWWETFDLIR